MTQSAGERVLPPGEGAADVTVNAVAGGVAGGAAVGHGVPAVAPQRQLLDNRATPCAVGLIKAARTMAVMPPGAELEIWSRDHFAPVEIPLFAERDGYQVRQLPSRGRWPAKYFVFLVSKPAHD